MSVAGVDGFYADALGNIFRASRVLVKAGEARDFRHEDESRGGFSRLPELHAGCVVSAGGFTKAQADSTHAVSQLGDLVAAGQLDLGLEGQLGSHSVQLGRGGEFCEVVVCLER